MSTINRISYLSSLGITAWLERKTSQVNLIALPLFSSSTQVGVIILDWINNTPEKIVKLLQAIVRTIGYSTTVHEPCDVVIEPSFSIVITFGKNASEYVANRLVNAKHFALSSCEELLLNSNLKREAWNLLKINSKADFFN